MAILGNRIPGKGTSRCKGPGVGVRLACSWKNKEPGVAGMAEYTVGKEVTVIMWTRFSHCDDGLTILL